ncbi:MAG: hypothetical protein WAM92_09660, partial [Mycobacterium sp.]
MDDVSVLPDPTADPLASDLVVACEAVWRSIQSRHPELPPVVMLLGSGVERGRLVKLGHWWGGRWLADGDVRGEVLLAGEALHLQAEDVFEVLLHEAAHGINAARGVKDTSRGGRYHNARFKSTALEVGLAVEQADPYGFAQTAVRPDTAELYATEIAHLAGVMRIARRIPGSAIAHGGDPAVGVGSASGDGDADPGGEGRRSKVRPAECGCGRRMRMAPSVLAQGRVICGNCDTEFVVDRGASRDEAAPSPVGRSGSPKPETDGADLLPRAEALLQSAATGSDGLDVVLRLGQWRGAFGGENERPLRIACESERPIWNQLARAVMATDGLLHGPTLTVCQQLELRAGDRVIVARAQRPGRATSLPEP